MNYKIAEFAGLMGITPKALRLYEKMGLLLPSFVDEKTQYRYYSSGQIREASLILQLKSVGFSLNEIKKFISSKFGFEEKRQILAEKKRILDEMLLELDYIKRSKLAYYAYIKKEPALNVMAESVHVGYYRDLIPLFYDFAENIVVNNCTLLLPEYCTIEYDSYSFKESDINAIFNIGVARAGGNVKCHVKSPKTYLCTVHNGGYDTIGNAYSFLEGYMKLNQLEQIGNTSERYIENYLSQKEENDYLTEIRIPIKEV